jgi:hypothetical protein
MDSCGGDSCDKRMCEALAGLTDIATDADVFSPHGLFHIRSSGKPDFVKNIRGDIFVVQSSDIISPEDKF